MDYRSTIQGWVQERLDEGLPADDAYHAVFVDLRGLYDASLEIANERSLSTTPSLLPTHLEKLREYVREGAERERSFQHNGEWYFRTTWFDPNVRRILENAGIVSRIGSVRDMEQAGIPTPYRTKGGVLLYKVNSDTIEI